MPYDVQNLNESADRVGASANRRAPCVAALHGVECLDGLVGTDDRVGERASTPRLLVSAQTVESARGAMLLRPSSRGAADRRSSCISVLVLSYLSFCCWFSCSDIRAASRTGRALAAPATGGMQRIGRGGRGYSCPAISSSGRASRHHNSPMTGTPAIRRLQRQPIFSTCARMPARVPVAMGTPGRAVTAEIRSGRRPTNATRGRAVPSPQRRPERRAKV